MEYVTKHMLSLFFNCKQSVQFGCCESSWGRRRAYGVEMRAAANAAAWNGPLMYGTHPKEVHYVYEAAMQGYASMCQTKMRCV